MEALEFLKERKRMCRSFGESCTGCQLEGTKCVVSSIVPDEDYKRIIATVEQWSKEHPRKTRQSVFLEQWPEAIVCDNGVLAIDSCKVEKTIKCNGMDCSKCRREFWMQEVE